MRTHRFDPISLLFGIITIVCGFAAINGHLGNLINDRPDALIPLALLAIGAVSIAVATRRSLQDADRQDNDQRDRAE